VIDLEQAVDELYGVAPEEFVPTRKRLAAELKGDGNNAAAAVIAAARKPTVAAWTLNQLARSRRKEVDLLLDAGHRLRQAQASLLRGQGRSQFESARSTQQSAIAKLAVAAEALLADHGGGSKSVLDQVTATLQAAPTSDEGRELLARGRFERPFTDTGGFDALAALAPAAPRKRQAKPKASDELRRAKADLRRAEQEADRLESRAASAERTVEAQRAGLKRTEEQARDARAAADDAAARSAAAARRVRSLERRR
jgi:hypothetical protein